MKPAMSKEPDRYNGFARFLHWSVAALIVGQYSLAELAELAESRDAVVQQLALWANHKSMGITILGLATIRIVWRLFKPPPPLPAPQVRWQRVVAGLTHWSLYALLFTLPLTGWLMSSAKSYSVSWFNLISLPDLVGQSEMLAAQLQDLHELLASLLIALASLHVLAALKHQWIDKDRLINRILDVPTTILFIGLVLGIALTLGSVTPNKTELRGNPVEVTESSVSKAKPRSDLPVWQIDYSRSRIEFRGEQAGAAFDGVWQSWNADIQFSRHQLEESRFEVVIDIASVATGDEERDDYIVGEDFFHQAKFEQAKFVATEFERTSDDGFLAQASLRMKGTSLPISFKFSVQQRSDGFWELKGSARLDRLAWNIGEGDWTDTSWVGQYVDVDVTVIAEVIESL
jgi:cytochrome b561